VEEASGKGETKAILGGGSCGAARCGCGEMDYEGVWIKHSGATAWRLCQACSSAEATQRYSIVVDSVSFFTHAYLRVTREDSCTAIL
jgi:hypothetical protein